MSLVGYRVNQELDACFVQARPDKPYFEVPEAVTDTIPIFPSAANRRTARLNDSTRPLRYALPAAIN